MKQEKKTALVFYVCHRGHWYPAQVVKSHREAEEIAHEWAWKNMNQANFDPFGWKVKRVNKKSNDYYFAVAKY